MTTAMILAAGRGERLRPLTDNTPKPLLRVNNRCLIEYHLLALKKAGITDVVINLHYRAQDIIDALGHGDHYGLRLHYSHEQTQALGVGGGIHNSLPQLGNEPFILISADLWTDYPLEKLLKQQTEAYHLILVDNPPYHSVGDFSLDQDNKLLNNPKKLTYAGIALMHPQLLADSPGGYLPLKPLLDEGIKSGLATGEHYSGTWINIGTAKELEQAKQLTVASEQ